MTEPQLIHVPPSQLKKSPTNPRKQLGDLSSLIESVKTKGVLEPILARPNGGPDHLEIICGERRWTAATKASLATVPVLVRELDDDEVLDVQLAENIERADLTPLEEAEAYAFRVKKKQSLAHIAERIGRTPAYVAQRLKLTELAPIVRERLAKDAISLGAALVLARIPDHKLQAEALKDVAPGDWRKPMSANEAAKHIAERYMLQLAKAPFDRADPRLVPGAGACTTCKKRTGNQAELFADVKSPDLCTDPPCFKSKLDAHWTIAKKDAKAKGVETIEGKAYTSKVNDYGTGSLRRLDEKTWDGKGEKTIRSLLGKVLDNTPITLGQDPATRQIVELVPKAVVDKALDRPKMSGIRTSASDAKKAKAEKLKRVHDKKLVFAACELVTSKLRAPQAGDAAFFVDQTIDHASYELKRIAAERRGLVKKRTDDAFNAIKKELDGMNAGQRFMFALELVLIQSSPLYQGNEEVWKETARGLGVDLKKLEKQIAAAEPTPKAKPAKKKPAKRTVKK